MFNAAPTIMHTIAILHIGNHEKKEQLDITQRNMMRSIIGWTRHVAEDLEIPMSRMNDGVQHTLHMFPSMSWSESIVLPASLAIHHICYQFYEESVDILTNAMESFCKSLWRM